MLKLFLDLDTQATRAIMYKRTARIRFRKMDLKRSIDARVVRAWLPAVSRAGAGKRIHGDGFSMPTACYFRENTVILTILRVFVCFLIVIVFNG